MTQSCWQVLDLDRESDTSTIKRRYAQLLKVTRPDEDPLAFQRLRDAYETAMQHARQPPADEPPAPPAAELIAPVITTDHHAWLTQVFAELSVAQLDGYLASARERDCQTLFELRLLHHCLAGGREAEDCVQWALDALHWISSGQSLLLPQQQVDQLALQLLHWRICALIRSLAAGDEAQALEGLSTLWHSHWLESLDRKAQAKDILLDWMAREEHRTPAMVERLFSLLKINREQTLDYRQGWAMRHLVDYLASHYVLKLRRTQLAMIWPVREEEQAVWLLFKDMSASEGRRLSDAATAGVWEACAELDVQMRHEYPELIPALRKEGVQDWRKWLARAEGNWLALWLMLVVIMANALPGLVKLFGGAPLPQDLRSTVLASIGAGIIVMLIISWVGRGLGRVARFLAVPDAWASERLLPSSIVNGGAGFLLLRHGVPCVLLGAICGGWAGGLGDYAWLYGSAVGVGSVAYALHNLRSATPVSEGLVDRFGDFWLRRKATIGWLLLGAVIVLGMVVRGLQFADVQEYGASQSCVAQTEKWGFKCETRPIQNRE